MSVLQKVVGSQNNKEVLIMSDRIVNAYTVSPAQIKKGDVMLFTIKAVVVRPGVYRLYRCPYSGDGIPQGQRILNEGMVCQELFPSLSNVAKPDTW